MNFLPIKVLILSMLILAYNALSGQDRCGTVQYSQSLNHANQTLRDKNFERWINNKKKERIKNSKDLRTQSVSYQIPVVVHIIHNGENIGSGKNISDEQIISQINALNRDFKRLNADTVNTPSYFKDVASGIDITFILAKTNPNGSSTNGIVRVQGNKNSYSFNESSLLSSLSYWPAEYYFNIWVCQISNNIIGYAQFPDSDLPGLENEVNNVLTDGVVIDYRVFGNVDGGNFNLASPYIKGRTATHEVGHFLGLRHIWGDDNGACGGNGDYVNDTPDQSEESRGCPQSSLNSCGNITMFQNYMDYTNDDCMNLFTRGQISRFEIVLENSPRRNSLLTSYALNYPDSDFIDLSIQNLINPGIVTCDNLLSPVVSLKNTGTIPVSSIKIDYQVNGGSKKTFNIFNLNLASDDTIQVTLPQVTFSNGANTLNIILVKVNDVLDENSEGNTATFKFVVNNTIVQIPLRENFEGSFQDTWTIVNTSGTANWQTVTTNFNKSLYFNSFNQENFGQQSLLVSPLLDLRNTTKATMVFDLSLAKRENEVDRFGIWISEDCGNDYGEIYIPGLEPINLNNTRWRPDDVTDWIENIIINLDDYTGKDDVRIVFAVQSKNGNNVYIDNIEFFNDDNPNVIEIKNDYSIYGYSSSSLLSELKIKFNLEKRQNVRYTILNVIGETEVEGELADVLNQTFNLPSDQLSKGLYTIRLSFNSKYYSEKFIR